MQVDRRKEMILKALPERKKTSKKLKQQVLQDIYYRASSLPQKKSLQVRQVSSSIPKRYSEVKGLSDEIQQKKNQKHERQQKQSFLLHERVERKNISLPKSLHTGQRMVHESTEILLPNAKKSDNQKTKVKKFSHKQERSSLTQSQQKYRLKTLEDILKKKDSKRLIRESFLHYNSKNSPVQTNPQPKIKIKQNKMMNMKHAFENRKFTNLSKYKMSTGSRNNDLFGQNKNEDRREPSYISRKVSKQNSKKRIKTQHTQKSDEEFLFLQEKASEKAQKKLIKDLILTDYVDSENSSLKKGEKDIITLEDSFKEAYDILKNYKNSIKLSKQSPREDKNLQSALRMLKNIQKQTGSLSRKTSLLLGKVTYYLGEFNNSIYYLENVFKESNYDLSSIDSLKFLENDENLWGFLSDFYFILGESYKNTQNYLCTIKILDQWEIHIVKKMIEERKQKEVIIEGRKQTISQREVYWSKNQIKQDTVGEDEQKDSERVLHDFHEKKRSHSILREIKESYLISAVKQKQRTQSLIKRQPMKFKSPHFSLKPKSKHLSIKTLSQINMNIDTEEQNKKVSEQDLEKCSEKDHFSVGYLMRARIQFQIKNFYASIQDYQKVLACDSINIEAGLQLATLYYKIGRKDKAVSFLSEFLDRIKYEMSHQPQVIQQIKYHLAVMLYKCQKYEQSFKLFWSMEKQGKSIDFMGQIYFYQALNMIKLKKIFSYQESQVQKSQQKQKIKNIEDILVNLQKSIDLSSSQFYLYAAYFLRIYMFIFQLKHYYGAQYEIDRLKAFIQRRKIVMRKERVSKQSLKQRIDYRIVSVQFFAKIITLDDLIHMTWGIICILKLKFEKGLQLISEIEKKVKFNKSMLTTDILGIDNQEFSRLNQNQQKYQVDQILKLLYQFKYYGLYTMRSYRKGLSYLQKIRQIDTFSYHRQSRLCLRFDNQTRAQHQYFRDQSDRINYLTLRSLILIDQKKFQNAFNVLKIIENESNEQQGQRLKCHKKIKSGGLEGISTVMEIKKQGNTVQIIKSLCYILLYKYLESQQSKQVNAIIELHSSHLAQLKLPSIQYSNSQSLQQRNDQILLVAEDLLSQCLICDQQNFQILFLIAVIHYELQRYDSALNYIRQAIELSDDHMIKHYYLKANMKMFLGKYQQAIKDYSNAVTVFKQFQKQKDQQKRTVSNDQHNINKNTLTGEDNCFLSSRFRQDSFAIKSNQLTNRSGVSSKDENQYYEEVQEMHPQIYLNRAICYLKYAYTLQYKACYKGKGKKVDEKTQCYHDVRENVINLKSAAGQDIKKYFNDLLLKLKVKEQSQNQKKKTKQKQQQQQTSQKSPIKSVKSQKRSPINISKGQSIEVIKTTPYVHLLLHTSDMQSILEINRLYVKQLGCKLLKEEQLMSYFYLAKELNNCLNSMDRIIKRYYLLQKSQKQQISRQSNLKKYSSSKVVDAIPQSEPYFKSRRQNRISRVHNYSQFNVQKYSTRIQNQYELKQKDHYQHEKTIRQQQKIRKLILDKKVLSALKNSSNNERQDYESALVNLLQQEENISKGYSSQTEEKDYHCGNIFKYSDLLFFIGVMYYLLDHYDKCIQYFEKSFKLKKETSQLLSLKAAVSKDFSSFEQDSSVEFQNSSQFQQMEVDNLRAFDQIYDNRIYSKEEIQYNIGVAYLLAGDYNSAYDHLEKYDNFVSLIEKQLTGGNEQQDVGKGSKGKLSKQLKDFPSKGNDTSMGQISLRTKSNDSLCQQLTDITPFPTHNRLCSIYPPKQLNGFKFSISFCLPKLELPGLGIFYPQEIQIGQKCAVSNKVLDFIHADDKKESKNNQMLDFLGISDDDNILERSKTEKFKVNKQAIVNFLDIVTLKDIAMKPIAPWIKKDKQKKCIRFTDNFLSESFDLITQCTTERRPKHSSRKEMFSHSKDNNESEQIQYGRDHYKKSKNKESNTQKQDQKDNKKETNQNYNFLKVKDKQKPQNKRYETIENQ